jgi:cellulose biosynthesis protein BcsQ
MPTSDSNTRVVAVANLKGGVGKITTVLNLAGFAGSMGKRVLAIDTDPQGSLSRVALPDDDPGMSLSDAFAHRARSLEAVLQAAIPWEGREYACSICSPRSPTP